MTVSGPHCVRNHHYGPATGQFTQPDPIGLAGGLNLYGYADGDPINNSDPFGLRACDPPGTCVSRGAAVGATMGTALGVTAAATCAGVTAGVCALGAPAIIGGSISLFTSAGIAAGAIEENASEIAAEMSAWGDRIKRRVERAIETVGMIVGLVNMNPPPKRPEDEDKPPPPVTAPRTGDPNPNP
jgi:hypothetical protein